MVRGKENIPSTSEVTRKHTLKDWLREHTLYTRGIRYKRGKENIHSRGEVKRTPTLQERYNIHER